MNSGGLPRTTENIGMGMIEEILDNQKKMMAMLEALSSDSGEAEESKPAPKKAAPKKAAPKKAAAKKEEPKDDGSDHTAEDVRGRFLAIQEAHGDDVAKAAIQHFGKKKLAEIIGDAEAWNEVMEVSAEILETGELPEEDADGGL